MNLGNIIVVEDDNSTRVTLTALLEDEGYQVFGCRNGTEAMGYLVNDSSEQPVDVVISDLRLPDMSGMDILASLKQNHPDAEFIFVSGHATLETAVEAVNQGAFAYQVKPLDMDSLISTVRNAKTQQRLKAENRELLSRLQGPMS